MFCSIDGQTYQLPDREGAERILTGDCPSLCPYLSLICPVVVLLLEVQGSPAVQWQWVGGPHRLILPAEW